MTPEKVKEQLRREGKTVVEVAKENNLNLRTVYCVLNGVNKGVRGEAHRAAVALGLKNSGEIAK